MNLKNLADGLNYQEKVETKIANYYLNNTSTSYFDIIQKANNIFRNYYINGKESIHKEVQEKQKMLDKINVREIENKINLISSEFCNYFKFDDLWREEEIIKNNLDHLTNDFQDITNKIKNEFKNKMNIKEN